MIYEKYDQTDRIIKRRDVKQNSLNMIQITTSF